MAEAIIQPPYSCLCFKCGKSYESQDKNDLDNEGKCQPCKEKAAVINANVQKIIDQRRANRPPPLPRVEPVEDASGYINARNFL